AVEQRAWSEVRQRIRVKHKAGLAGDHDARSEESDCAEGVGDSAVARQPGAQVIAGVELSALRHLYAVAQVGGMGQVHGVVTLGLGSVPAQAEGEGDGE